MEVKIVKQDSYLSYLEIYYLEKKIASIGNYKGSK